MSSRETFSSRWGLILAGLGMAVGTGNLWRFPRIAAQNGGAAFLIPWFIFLFVWSLPLIIAEFGIGRGARRGVVGAFSSLIGGRFAWMGGFIAVTTVMILFYYSVVTGWALKYFLLSATGGLAGQAPEAYWDAYSTSIWQPIGFHLAAVGIGAAIILRGVVSGIERANRVLIPVLFALLIVAVARSVTLPGAHRGLEFLFNPDLSTLTSYRTWLEALTQSAWSTGAGWGMILTYATYMRKNDDVVLNATTIGFGDNSASLLAGMAVVPTAFAILSTEEAMTVMASSNYGLTFIWIPQLFERVPGGAIFLPLFFLALFSAALSSLIAMIELATRILIDGGMVRRRAVRLVAGAVAVCGIPSAVNVSILENQDWVWGIALMISGLFISIAATQYGQERFRTELVNVPGNDFNLGRLYSWVLKYLVPAEFVAMFAWWMYQAATVYDPDGWWNPTHTFSVGTCLVQWGLAFVLLISFNKRMARASVAGSAEAA
ncbi:MAG: sodium-dependent transporter [Vicinamibacterales bacterium]|nr:sodium-dependent transporter [Vicinamibacterales bacterium]MDP7672008.1 sodium-dependent transporter [Vicinamibacterales bacterium]HJO37224.1 sodium-dependent transporter [Vicinamibacterales bacterium]